MNSTLLLGMPGGGEWLLIFIFIIPALLLPLLALIDILRNDFKGSNDKVIWVIVVLFLPFLGSLLYFLIGRNQRAIS
jgi:hypothetical protein